MPCPKCGGNEGYIAHDYFTGWAEFIGDWDENNEDSPCFLDSVRLRRESKTAICLGCGKRVPRPFRSPLKVKE